MLSLQSHRHVWESRTTECPDLQSNDGSAFLHYLIYEVDCYLQGYAVALGEARQQEQDALGRRGGLWLLQDIFLGQGQCWLLVVGAPGVQVTQ